MSESQLAAIIEQLQAEETTLVGTVGTLKGKLTKAEAALERVQTAQAALNQKTRAKRASAKKAPTRNDVIQIIRMVAGDKKSMKVDELRQQVTTLLSEQGFSKLGFSLRFNEALQELGLDAKQAQS